MTIEAQHHVHYMIFPFEELERYDTYREMRASGLPMSHLWSVYEGEEQYYWDEGVRRQTFVTGPAHHYVDIVYWFSTREEHDGNTYFEEVLERDIEPQDYEDPDLRPEIEVRSTECSANSTEEKASRPSQRPSPRPKPKDFFAALIRSELDKD